MTKLLLLGSLLGLVACGSPSDNGADASLHGDGSAANMIDAPMSATGKTVFVIVFENKGAAQIYGNTAVAPYFNGLLPTAAYASKFGDELPALVSEPHYVWMEAGTNVFTDRTFSGDNDPGPTNSTTSTAHLSTQLDTAGIPWMSYQQGITSGTCPIATAGDFAPKHDPFVFFQDVSGNPPVASNARCGQHHKAYSQFAADLANGMTGYVFITPDLCHDMHGAADCAAGTASDGNITAGDTWMSTEVPRIIDYTKTHDAILILTWDEGDATNLMPTAIFGPHVKVGVNATAYTHSSMLKSTEEFLGVPVLTKVAAATDFTAMFETGHFP